VNTTITTTLGQLATSKDAFERLIAMKLAIKAAYHVKKLLAVVRPELEHFHELRNDLIKELGRERPPTDVERALAGAAPIWDVLPEHLLTFHARIMELSSAEVTLPVGPVDLAWLGDQDITAADLDALGPLVCWQDEGR
jgi:hypothetical protein